MEIEETVLQSKIEQVKDKRLHTNWLGWYEKRKGLSESVRQIYSKQMFDGIVEDFYSVFEAQQQEIERFRAWKIIIIKESFDVAKKYIKIDKENTKLKEENKALSGVIKGMKLIIKNLEK